MVLLDPNEILLKANSAFRDRANDLLLGSAVIFLSSHVRGALPTAGTKQRREMRTATEGLT